MANGRSEFCTFDEALEMLGTSEGVLKSMVSEGEIRAFREGDAMKFKRAEVATLVLIPRRLGEVHALLHGLPLCGFTRESAATWPLGHMWTDELERVSCTVCGKMAKALAAVEGSHYTDDPRDAGPVADPDPSSTPVSASFEAVGREIPVDAPEVHLCPRCKNTAINCVC